MIRATRVQGQHRWKQAAADTVVLDFDERHRQHMAMVGTRGLEFLLDLETAVALRGGDALVLEDGRLVEVVAAPERLVEIRGSDPHHLVRIAWHLGSRQLPMQIMAKGLRIRKDHVIEAMVQGLGAKLVAIEAPFDPEGGAYAETHAPPDEHDHGHVHGAHCSHGHGAAHVHEAVHVHDENCGHDHGATHVHDANCGHDHKHGHDQDHGHQHGHQGHDHK